jgi:hypothetical protein
MTSNASEPESPGSPEPVSQASAQLIAAIRSSLTNALAAGEAERTYGRILPRRIDPPPTLAVGVAAARDATRDSGAGNTDEKSPMVSRRERESAPDKSDLKLAQKQRENTVAGPISDWRPLE